MNNASLPLDKSNVSYAYDPINENAWMTSELAGFLFWYFNDLLVLIAVAFYPTERNVSLLSACAFFLTASELAFGEFYGSYQHAIYGVSARKARATAQGNMTAYILLAAFAFAAAISKLGSLDQPDA